jgi:hypothetical protein
MGIQVLGHMIVEFYQRTETRKRTALWDGQILGAQHLLL